MLKVDDAFESILSISDASSHEEAKAPLARLQNILGFDGYGMLKLHVDRPDVEFIVDGFPVGWTEHYAHYQLARCCPYKAAVETATVPFTWGEVRSDAYTDPLRVRDQAAVFGFKAGLYVPIIHKDGRRGSVCYATETDDLEPDRRHLLTMTAMFLQAATARQASESSPILSARTVEALRWIAKGKNLEEAADLMDISIATVRYYLKHAAEKLGTNGRMHTVTEALKRKLLGPL